MPDLLERLQTALESRYSVEREIGRGGMATVFLAEDLKHHRQVAIKVLHPELAAAVGTERFGREIEIAAKLDHPHILPVHDSGEADGLLFYVMPYVEGESLRDRLEREKQLSVDEAVRFAREVADGLHHAHEHGVVHRDIKPANIMLSGGHARIADFGVARAVEEAGEAKVTATGLAVGSPLYGAAARGAPGSGGSDQGRPRVRGGGRCGSCFRVAGEGFGSRVAILDRAEGRATVRPYPRRPEIHRAAQETETGVGSEPL
jgi:serine/threonine-protein kinase